MGTSSPTGERFHTALGRRAAVARRGERAIATAVLDQPPDGAPAAGAGSTDTVTLPTTGESDG